MEQIDGGEEDPDMDYEACWDCGGTGYTHHDCGEDCCACRHPEDNVPCETCGTTGILKYSSE